MSLYPITKIDLDTALSNYNVLASGSLVVVPLNIVANTLDQLIVTQAAPTQDFSIRVWVSELIDGISVVSQPPAAAFWTPNKISDEIRILYTSDRTPPDGSIAIPLEIGSYFLNVLNLSNSTNLFTMSITAL